MFSHTLNLFSKIQDSRINMSINVHCKQSIYKKYCENQHNLIEKKKASIFTFAKQQKHTYTVTLVTTEHQHLLFLFTYIMITGADYQLITKTCICTILCYDLKNWGYINTTPKWTTVFVLGVHLNENTIFGGLKMQTFESRCKFLKILALLSQCKLWKWKWLKTVMSCAIAHRYYVFSSITGLLLAWHAYCNTAFSAIFMDLWEQRPFWQLCFCMLNFSKMQSAIVIV